jgi:hypothetical protein
MVWNEAIIARQRVNQRIATDTTGLIASIQAALTGKDKGLKAFFKRLTYG